MIKENGDVALLMGGRINRQKGSRSLHLSHNKNAVSNFYGDLAGSSSLPRYAITSNELVVSAAGHIVQKRYSSSTNVVMSIE